MQLTDNLEKQPSKVEMAKKVEAWKTINSVLVRADAEFMNKLKSMLTEKSVQHYQIKEKCLNQSMQIPAQHLQPLSLSEANKDIVSIGTALSNTLILKKQEPWYEIM